MLFSVGSAVGKPPTAKLTHSSRLKNKSYTRPSRNTGAASTPSKSASSSSGPRQTSCASHTSGAVANCTRKIGRIESTRTSSRRLTAGRAGRLVRRVWAACELVRMQLVPMPRMKMMTSRTMAASLSRRTRCSARRAVRGWGRYGGGVRGLSMGSPCASRAGAFDPLNSTRLAADVTAPTTASTASSLSPKRKTRRSQRRRMQSQIRRAK